MLKNSLLPGNLYFAKGYAAMDAIKICPTVPRTLIKMLLNRYLLKGTKELANNANKSLKFLVVGFITKNLGGKINNSSIGLKARVTVYSNGSAIKAAIKPSSITIIIFPQVDLEDFNAISLPPFE